MQITRSSTSTSQEGRYVPCTDWLKPGGRIFLGLPNIAGAVARIFSKCWYHFAAPLHVVLYTPIGIRTMLEESGFTVTRIAYNSDPISIPMSFFIRVGRYPVEMSRLRKLFVRALSVPMLPFTRLLDEAEKGDCIEVHAVKG